MCVFINYKTVAINHKDYLFLGFLQYDPGWFVCFDVCNRQLESMPFVGVRSKVAPWTHTERGSPAST